MKKLKAKSEPAYLTPEEAAELLRVHIKTVYRWCQDGKLKAVKFGDTWRIPTPLSPPD